MACLQASTFNGVAVKRSAAPRAVARAAPVTAASLKETVQQVAKTATAVALALTMAGAASADVSGLTKCSESAAFKKVEAKELKALDKRAAKYAPESAPFLALQATKEKTTARFAKYASSSLLCGTDGLPHLIADGDPAHAGEFTIPGLGFLYIAGWIGYVGRDYIRKVGGTKDATDKEIIIDVPLASSLMWRGAVWPLLAFNDLKNGDLLEDDKNITVSPR